MRPVPPRISAEIEALLAATEAGLGLLVCVHEWVDRSGIPARWRQHRSPACLPHKRAGGICDPHCGQELHGAAEGRPEGLLHTCPVGHSELVVPIRWQGWYVGLLFAGTCWLGPGEAPHPALERRFDRSALAARLPLLRAVAERIAQLLDGEPGYEPPDRRARIQAFVQEHLDRPVGLAGLAAHLGLSRSRCAHAVREIFGCSFGELLREQQLAEAARLLATTRLSVAEIAALTGHADPNYFSRRFAAAQGLPPLRYRARHRAGV